MFKRFSVVTATAALLLPAIAMGAVFSLATKASAREVITCESNDRERNICRVDTGDRVRLVEQLSDASCSGNWGYGRDFIWVRRGCRARFLVESRYRRDNRNRDRYDRDRDRYDRDRDRYDRDRDRYDRYGR